MRWAILTLVLLPSFAQAQIEVVDQDQVSNDKPSRPFVMPAASTEVKEALDDFERFRRRNAWERALKALYTIPEAQARRFIDGDKGFIVPVARKRHALLNSLSPEGRTAYRLFYDAEARKLFEDADGPAELGNLERVYSAYFLTTIGDNAADRLGDLYFELGRFDRAADCWLSILREYPDSDLTPALVALKAALALTRAGRVSELTSIRRELADRYNDEKITVGGQTGSPLQLLERLAGADPQRADATVSTPQPLTAGPDLSAPVEPAWQLRFADSVEAGMTSPELTQWESNPLSTAIPTAVSEGANLFVNYLGHVFALDLKTGKLRWRSAAFHHLEVSAMQNQGRGNNPTRYAIMASGDFVWSLARDPKDQNFYAPFLLTCRRAETGEIVWHSKDLADYAAFDLVSPPLLAAGKLFIVARTPATPQQQQGLPQELVLAIQPRDGKLLWKTEIGTFRQNNMYQFFYYNQAPVAEPRLVYRAGALFVDTHVGVLARVDADSGSLEWGFGYRTDAAPIQGRIFFGPYQPPDPIGISSQPLSAGETLLIKGVQSDRLYAIDTSRMALLWERPIAKSARLLDATEQRLFLGGPELSALNLGTKALAWSTRLPHGSTDGEVLVRSEGLWQLTPRGIFEIDPQSGAVRRIFRGQDLGAAGGDLLLTDDRLVAVSNRTISAYPRRPAPARAERGEDPALNRKRASNE